jgi:TolB-like protein/DNA-binding winged helix-turn-helix (wHTH) protein/tetratricopeptide (TPR) repeat protein
MLSCYTSGTEVRDFVNELPPSRALVRFGAFELDAESGELLKHGVKVRLQEQPFQVLRILLEHRGKVVAREELQRRIWPADTFVDFDRGLYNSIKKLREALGDDAEKPRFIETFSKRGYRFIGHIQNGASPPAVQGVIAASTPKEASVPEPQRKAFIWGLALGATVLAALVLVLGLNTGGMRDRLLGKSAALRIQSLAVLPLQNLSADPAQEYFSDGMTDALITGLAQIGSLKVISRTSSMQYKQTKKSLPEIARELNVDGIVEGTVQRSGDRVRITAQLIHGPSDKHLWANSYERDMRDVFTLEREVTDDIAHRVQAQLTTEHQGLPVQLQPLDPNVLDAYLQGNYRLHKADTAPRDEELRKAGEFFQHAIDADPNFAPGYIGLSKAHHNLWWASSEDFSIMKGAAEKAVALDPSSSDARQALGVVRFEDWDWQGAEAEFRRAVSLNPNNASAHDSLGEAQDVRGRFEEGWKEQQIAQEIDPDQDHLTPALYRRREYDRAIELLRRGAERSPDDAVIRWFLAQNYAQKGMYKDWLEEAGRSLTLFGFPEIAGHLRIGFATSGYAGALGQLAEGLEQMNERKQGYFPGVLAQTYAALGDKDRAFYWLEQGCDHPHLDVSDPVLQFVKVDPGFAPLRSDPRFNDILRRMGLPQ